jgi:DNA modification methylase
MAVEYWPIFRADDWLLWSRRIWCKPNARVNSLWCIGSNRAATDWEHLWTWRKPGKPIIERVDGEMRSALGWYQSSLMHGVDVGKEVHGAGMALGIVEWMLNIHSRPNAVVYEPFCGTGTTIIGGHRLGRRVYATELSPKYADVILRRATAEGLTVERVESPHEAAVTP